MSVSIPLVIMLLKEAVMGSSGLGKPHLEPYARYARGSTASGERLFSFNFFFN